MLILIILPVWPIFKGLLFGWLNYLKNTLPQVRFNPEIALHAALAFVLSIYGLHRILGWWTKRQQLSTPWRLDWTLKIAIMALLLFAVSISATGIIHQIGWLVRTKPLIENRSGSKSTRALSNVKQVDLALRLYRDDHKGKNPKSLDDLVPDYLDSNRLLFSGAFEADEPPQRMLYFASSVDETSYTSEFIILASPPLSGKRAILDSDGYGEIVTESKFQTQIQRQQAAGVEQAR